MTTEAINDLSFHAAVYILFGSACSAIGYLVGKKHGHEEGRIIGENTTRRQLVPRIMSAKRDGTHCGRILGMREAIREILPKTTLKDTRVAPCASKASLVA